MGTIFTNIFGAIVGFAMMAWIGWIAVVTSAKERMERTCAPVVWTGKVGVSIAMLADTSEKAAKSTADWFDGANYGCQYTLWRLFYEDDWKKEGARQAAEQEAINEAARKRATPKPGNVEKSK